MLAAPSYVPPLSPHLSANRYIHRSSGIISLESERGKLSRLKWVATLKQRLRALAPGLTPRAVLDKLAAIQMVDIHLPTTDGRYLVLPRYTQPDQDQQLVLHHLQLKLPAQPPPRITAKALRSA